MRLLLLLFCTLIFTSCSKKADLDEDFSPSSKKFRNLELARVNTIVLKNTQDTTNIARLSNSFAINDDGSRMAFYDNIFKHFLITDKKGNILFTIGKKGKGPREFVQVLSWNFDEHNNLIVFDEAQKQLKIFSKKGTLKKTLNIFTKDNLFEASRSLFARDSLIYLSTIESKYSAVNDAWKSKMVAVYNYDGQLEKLIGKYDPYVKEAPIYTSATIFDINYKSNTLFSSQQNSYRIQTYSLKDFRRKAYFGIKSSHYKESEEKISAFFPTAKIMRMSIHQSFPAGLYSTPKYVFLFFENISKKWNQTRDPQYKDYFISVYGNSMHDFLSEIKLPYHLAAVHENKLYLIQSSNPDHYTIGVYEIQKNS